MKLLTLLSVLLVLGLSISFAENHDWELARTLTLKFEYAAREGKSLGSSYFSIIWNGKTMANVDPKNYDIHTYKL